MQNFAHGTYDHTRCTSHNIRNICILAHVDHGKTSIADCLLALNGLVSKRGIGTTKYLDDRRDEQQRQITMKSSVVSIIDTLVQGEGTYQSIPVILNLVDTPGHIDFSPEVTNAVRISDGALIIVDAVEGVCAQTRTAIKQAYDEKLVMLLIINKIDKFIIDLKQEQLEVFRAVVRIVEDCNAYLSYLFQLDIFSNPKQQEDEENLLFDPVRGNVIFASAIDGWGFTLRNIAYEYKCLFQEETEDSLTVKLWDFNYFSTKDGIIKRGAIETRKNCLFVQVVTSLLFFVYNNLITRQRLEVIDEIVQKLHLKKDPPAHHLYKDARSKLRCLMEAWQPLGKTIVLQSFLRLPSPSHLEDRRINYLLNGVHYTTLPEFNIRLSCAFHALKRCDKFGLPVAYISKVLVLDKRLGAIGTIAPVVFPQPKPLTDDESSKQGDQQKASNDCAPSTNHVSEEKKQEASKGPSVKSQEPAKLTSKYTIDELLKMEPKELTLFVDAHPGPPVKPARKYTTEELLKMGPKQVQLFLDSHPGLPVKKSASAESAPNLPAEDIGESVIEESESETADDAAAELPENAAEKYEIIAVTRIYSGVVHVGQELYLLSPAHDPVQFELTYDKRSFFNKHRTVKKVTVTGVYVLLGRERYFVNALGAGYICGITFSPNTFCQYGTLSTSMYMSPIREPLSMEPIVYNVINPTNPSDLVSLRNNLRLLQLSDSSVKVVLNNAGEHMLVTTGEVHLQKCLEDLTNKFEKLDFQVSDPFYPLRETVEQNTGKIISRIISSSQDYKYVITIDLTAIPIPDEIVEILASNYSTIKTVQEDQLSSIVEIRGRHGQNLLRVPEKKQHGFEFEQNMLERLQSRLMNAFKKYKTWSSLTPENIWRLGPGKDNINLLLNCVPKYTSNIFTTPDECDSRIFIENYIVNAFNMVCNSGPLCEEPLMYSAFIVKTLTISDEVHPLIGLKAQEANSLTQQFRQSFRDALMQQNMAIMEPLLVTFIETDVQNMGKLYAEVQKRYGKIIDNLNLDETEKKFTVKALVPACETRGFAGKVRKISSGGANPSLNFSHYQIVSSRQQQEDSDDEEEEKEADMRANRLIKDMRRRKGLPISDDQVIIHAEKQRTLKK